MMHRRFMVGTLTIAMIVCRRAHAHPTASTEVAVSLDAGSRTFDVTIATDPDALIAKLEALSSAPLTASHPADRRGRLAALAATLADHIEVRFDGGRQAVGYTGLSETAGQPAVIRLRGAIPDQAWRVTWQTSLIYGSYPLVIRGASAGDGGGWLQGTETSQPFMLNLEADHLRRVIVRSGSLLIGAPALFALVRRRSTSGRTRR